MYIHSHPFSLPKYRVNTTRHHNQEEKWRNRQRQARRAPWPSPLGRAKLTSAGSVGLSILNHFLESDNTHRAAVQRHMLHAFLISSHSRKGRWPLWRRASRHRTDTVSGVNVLFPPVSRVLGRCSSSLAMEKGEPGTDWVRASLSG